MGTQGALRIGLRNQAPESLLIRAGDEGLVVGLQLVDRVPELFGDVDRVAVEGEPVVGGGVAGDVLGPGDSQWSVSRHHQFLRGLCPGVVVPSPWLTGMDPVDGEVK
jgi:hypothetical protein